MDLFEAAARAKLRFESPKGLLTAEDLFDLPLTSTTGKANLDTMAISLDRQIKESSVTSFVDQSTAGDPTLKLRFDIILSVIATKKAENAAALQKRANAEKKQQLLSLIAQKQNEQLAGKSLDELMAMVNGLEG